LLPLLLLPCRHLPSLHYRYQVNVIVWFSLDTRLLLNPMCCCCCRCCPAGIFLHCIIAYQVNVNVWCSLLLQLTNPK
jgi:hypothetical protein